MIARDAVASVSVGDELLRLLARFAGRVTGDNYSCRSATTTFAAEAIAYRPFVKTRVSLGERVVTDEQVRLLRRRMSEGEMKSTAAAAAGMCVRSGRQWETGPLPSTTKEFRSWRTRPDPFVDVWNSMIVPLLEVDEKGCLESKTILDEVMVRCPGVFHPEQVRTLQRRIRDWRACHGPAKEVIFPQVHVAGYEAAIDFTHAKDLNVTIRGEAFAHLLFEFVLTCSGWVWACVALGETFEALVAGVQGAFWALGGVTEVLRSDNLSAATHELKQGGGRALNERFRAVLEHYKLRSTRINPGKSKENGSVEKRHDLTKRAVAQALVLRGSRDFDSRAEYEQYVRDVVDRTHNQRVAERIAEERQALRSLPSTKVPEYSVYKPMVRSWSTIQVSKRTYSVPSRLIGLEVEARQHAEFVEVFYRNKLVETMPRQRGDDGPLINYRHVIWSLVRKPGAFAQYRFREALFPTLVFRRTYDALKSNRGDRADVEYVRVLHLAASTMESTVESALTALLERGKPFDYAAVKALAQPHDVPVPTLSIGEPDLAGYDRLLMGGVG